MWQSLLPFALLHFDSPWMLLWTASAVLPLLIHLWYRRKYHDVPWAAMKFLLAALRSNARRLRIEQWILLAVRMLVLLLLALALADPILSAIPGLTWSLVRRPRCHRMVVLDGSYSMDYRQGNLTRFQQAQQAAAQWVARCREADGFTLVLMSQPSRVIIGTPTFDRQAVLRELEDLTVSHTGADLEDTLRRVRQVVSTGQVECPDLQQIEVCFFTDLGRTTWKAAARASCQQRIQDLARQATIALVDLGQGGCENLAVTGLTQQETYATAGNPLHLHATLQNFGLSDRHRQPVRWFLDGQPAGEQRVDVAAGEQAGVELTCRLDSGPHAVEVRLGDDPLRLDNHRYRSVSVRNVLNVLCVRGRYGAARNVALALAPDSSDLTRVRTQVVGTDQLLDLDLPRFDSVFLCNVSGFAEDEAQWLHHYVQDGGGLVFFLGDQVQAENYNRLLGKRGDRPSLLPAKIGPVADTALYHFDPRDYAHPIVRPFRGFERSGLLTTPVWRYVQLELDEPSQARVALWFDTGDPAIVESPVREGRSIIVATSATDASVDQAPWSALATWPSFPPLTQELLAAAVAGQDKHLNLLVGEDIESSVRDPTGRLALSLVQNGQTERVPLTPDGRRSRWVYSAAGSSGIYRAEYQPPTAAAELFAVNLDTRESDLRRIDPGKLPRAIRRTGPGQLAAVASLEAGIGGRRMFRLLLAAVLLLLLVETFLAWYFGRTRA